MNITTIITPILVMVAIGLIYSLAMVMMNKIYYRKKSKETKEDDCLPSESLCSSCGITGCSINPAKTKMDK
ncbi:MAG: hypothetical protein PHE86_02740 [Candidatus Marinimicrobia bacterium]|nr:hypothetical protein [Candidatus Neomarinimicrobiota bacterium]